MDSRFRGNDGLGVWPLSIFVAITVALRRPNKGMKMAPLGQSGVGLSPRAGDCIPAFAGMQVWA